MLGLLFDLINYASDFYIHEDKSTDLKQWLLKSLRPHSTWKPSDEQMGVIEAVINNRSFQRRHLDSLYEQLKKLREEVKND